MSVFISKSISLRKQGLKSRANNHLPWRAFTVFTVFTLATRLASRSMAKAFYIFGLLLLLLVTQQLVIMHGYSHVEATSSMQSALQDDSPNVPDGLQVCDLCAASSGLHFIAPCAGQACFATILVVLALLAAVSPAPTFSFPAAYLSRAPPVLLN
jgi:hypothetical protein